MQLCARGLRGDDTGGGCITLLRVHINIQLTVPTNAGGREDDTAPLPVVTDDYDLLEVCVGGIDPFLLLPLYSLLTFLPMSSFPPSSFLPTIFLPSYHVPTAYLPFQSPAPLPAFPLYLIFQRAAKFVGRQYAEPAAISNPRYLLLRPSVVTQTQVQDTTVSEICRGEM